MGQIYVVVLIQSKLYMIFFYIFLNNIYNLLIFKDKKNILKIKALSILLKNYTTEWIY